MKISGMIIDFKNGNTLQRLFVPNSEFRIYADSKLNMDINKTAKNLLKELYYNDKTVTLQSVASGKMEDQFTMTFLKEHEP